jgi:small conductance mechanosensitive channel
MIRNPNRRRLGWCAALVATCVLGSSAPLAAAPPEKQTKPPPPPIRLESGPEVDRAIEQRLEAIFSEIEPMRGIEVEVDAGVVHLSGQVRELEARRQAQAMAERVEGVAAVTNEIQQDAELRDRLEPILEGTRERTTNWLTYLPLLLAAAAVIALAWLLARVVTRRSRKRGESDNTFKRQFIDQILRFGILVIGIAIALELLGARGLLGGLIGTAGVIGIAIGVAFKSVGEAYAASVMLSLRRPFDPLDYVRIEDQEGTVVRLTSRATVLMTLDGNHVLIPNSTVYEATIINFTRNPQRRFWFQFGVSHDVELERVQALVVATLATVPGVLAEPAPFCYVDGFDDAGMILSATGWIDQRNSDWFKVSSEAKRMIKAALDRADIEMPEQSLRLRTTFDESPTRTDASEKTTEPTPAPVCDVSPDPHVGRRVAEERASRVEDDLLRDRGRHE